MPLQSLYESGDSDGVKGVFPMAVYFPARMMYNEREGFRGKV